MKHMMAATTTMAIIILVRISQFFSRYSAIVATATVATPMRNWSISGSAAANALNST